MKIALLPGGFKPPHLGHYNMAKYLADFADKVIVRIGQKERDGIGAPLALEVWSFYKEFDPDPRAKKLVISVAQSPSPVKDVYDFVEKIAPEGSTVILGMGEKDAADGRYNSIPKFAEPRNIKAEIELVPPQAGGISGTRMREIIKTNDKVEFFKYIPDYLPEEIKEELWTKLVDSTMPTNIDEMMSGTMNQQEMNKHLANMKKLRKFFSTQGDQMTQIPTKLTSGLKRKLFEGRYDMETLLISRFIVDMFKDEFGKKYEDEFEEIGKLRQSDKEEENAIPYNLELYFFPTGFDKLGPDPFIINAGADDEAMYIQINYQPDMFPQAYSKLIPEIKDAVRHELEHIGQFHFDKGVKSDLSKNTDDLPTFDYLTLDYEIPAHVQGIYKNAKTQKIKFSDALDNFLDSKAEELSNEQEAIVRKIYIDYAKKNLPAAQLENFPPYKANQVQQTRYKASDTFTNDRKKAKKLGYLEEMKLFSKDWWLDIITEEFLNEGGAAGHMAHPFDLPNVKTGKDLIKSFEQAAESLKKEPGSVKIDGVNASIRLINNAGKRQFAMDRGSKKELDLRGVTKADLKARFGAGHGMIKAGGDVLDIFNDALPTIQEELEALGLWDNPNIMFNMEYVSGKSNVQDYGKNFLAIHGLLEVETKEVQGARKMLVKRITSEKGFAESDMNELLKKLEPFAKKKGFEIYGSVPTTFTKDPDFKSVLGKSYKIEFAEGAKVKSLAQWLNDVTNIPAEDRIQMNLETGGTKDVGALSKQVYFAIFGGETVDDLFDNEQDIQKAIQGAITYLATEKLGDAILDVLDSPMGSVNDHEGVVIRDPKISNRPFKITGKFITGGVSSQFQSK